MHWVLTRMESHLQFGERAWGVKSIGLGVKGIQVARYLLWEIYMSSQIHQFTPVFWSIYGIGK